MSIKTKIIQTSKSKILIIGGLPENEEMIYDKSSKHIVWNEDDFNYYILPQGNWQLLGRLSELSEEQSDIFIPFDLGMDDVMCYPNYKKPLKNGKIEWWTCSSSKESFISLLEANDVVLENKYGKTPEEDNKLHQAIWDREQEKVFNNPVIFIEI